jgi:threonine dehydratase
MRRSRESGWPVTIELTPTIADGLMPVRPGDLTFAHVHELADDVVVVSDEEILEASTRLLKQAKLVVEFSGAATAAAVMSGRVKPDRTAIVLSGGNLDAAKALSLMAAQPMATAEAAA